ncbi:MAG: pyridoxine 5'-phosphate synthase [OM182 bacterium]|jgi:pyridoxine 5-phosphate synthase|nr:pyridoxine 5'-phosphate synthase [OM182 bacterium]
MTVLSVNVNKIALLRNSRGRDFPSVIDFSKRVIGLGVKGITVHPRPDERHVTRRDIRELTSFLADYPGVEFNIEGYPSEDFMELVLNAKPDQCTLVPDAPEQLTSDHGWDISAHESLLSNVLGRLRDADIRSSIFLDPDAAMVERVLGVGADRIELYTESYAQAFGSESQSAVLDSYRAAALRATELGIGLNAGHDLDLANLGEFLTIPAILEVSIGHALVVESLHEGVDNVVKRYLTLCAAAA